MSYNTPDDLTGAYKILGEQFTDNDLQDSLDRAHRKLDVRVGREFTQVASAEIDDQEDFQLTFSEWESFSNARLVGKDERIDSSYYTATTSTGTVSFTTSWAEDNVSRGTRIQFRYVPSMYVDLELWYAILDLTRKTSLQTRDGQTSISVDEAKEAVQELENGISSKSGNRFVRDHNPRFGTGSRTL